MANVKGGSFVGGSSYIQVDTTDANARIEELRRLLTEEQFNRLMYRTFAETGRRVRTIMRQDIPRTYEATARWVGNNVGRARTSIGAQGVQCSIPVSGAKGVMGGQFTVVGPRGRPRRGVLQRFRIRVLQGHEATLPPRIRYQPMAQEQPPFRVRTRTANGSTRRILFVRKGKKRLPILRVVGVGVPQMPLNQSERDVSRDILSYLETRLEHNFDYMITRGHMP